MTALILEGFGDSVSFDVTCNVKRMHVQAPVIDNLAMSSSHFDSPATFPSAKLGITKPYGKVWT